MMKLAGALLVFAASACAPAAVHHATKPPPLSLPRLTSAATTATKTLVPKNPAKAEAKNPALDVPDASTDPLGELVDGPGESRTVQTVDGSPAPAQGANPKRLARFVHFSDLQLMDDESPARAADFDSQSVTSAIRPQDSCICRMVNAAVRTIDALSDADKIDFVLMGGDISDSAQRNEVQWAMQIMDGSDRVKCDSGHDDDIIKNGDDGKDPFVAQGLSMPWKWVSGNHDSLVQGTFAINDDQRTIALGDDAKLGTRDYAGGGYGSIVDGPGVIADPQRALVSGTELLDLVGGDDDGHGLAHTDHSTGRAFHSFDVGDLLTFFVLDTTHAPGGGEGVLTQRDIATFVKPVLDDAKARGRVVVIASHHAVSSLTSDGGQFGVAEPDALTSDQWKAFLGGYGNVLFSMVGHAHRNQVRAIKTPNNTYWEVMTAALADWPHQFRVVEIWDDDNGTLRLESDVVNYVSDDDPVAELGRRLGLVDFQSGWQPNDGRGQVADRNVELIIPKP
jgi:hypothetical protein